MSEDQINTIVDFSEDIASAEAPPPLPKGNYPAEIKAAQVKISDNSGNPYADVAFFVAPEAFPADFPSDVAPEGLTLNYRRLGLQDNPASRFRVRTFSEAIGAPMAKRIDTNDWIGRTANIEIEHEEWEGVTRAVIKKVLPSQ